MPPFSYNKLHIFRLIIAIILNPQFFFFFHFSLQHFDRPIIMLDFVFFFSASWPFLFFVMWPFAERVERATFDDAGMARRQRQYSLPSCRAGELLTEYVLAIERQADELLMMSEVMLHLMLMLSGALAILFVVRGVASDQI